MRIQKIVRNRWFAAEYYRFEDGRHSVCLELWLGRLTTYWSMEF